MIYSQALYTSLLAISISFLPLLHAQHLRASPPLPTPGPLLIRQEFTCAASATACNDGSGGCCDIGVPCTQSGGVPFCEKTCGFADIRCTGVLTGLCCDFGYTCNYQKTMCLSTSLFDPVFTPIGPIATHISIDPPISITLIDPINPPVLTSIRPHPPASPVQPEPSATATPEPTVPTPTTPFSPPISSTSPEERTSLSEPDTPSTDSTEAEPTRTPSIGNGDTTLITIATAPTQFVAGNGQNKIGFDVKILLAGFGLAFLWGY